MGSFRNPRTRDFASKPRLPLRAKVLASFRWVRLGSFSQMSHPAETRLPNSRPGQHMSLRRSAAMGHLGLSGTSSRPLARSIHLPKNRHHSARSACAFDARLRAEFLGIDRFPAENTGKESLRNRIFRNSRCAFDAR